MTTGNNAKYLRRWFEVSIAKFSAFGGDKWLPFNKGGEFRRWYGNHEFVVNYVNEGAELLRDADSGLTPGFRHDGKNYYGREGITWSAISSENFSARLMPDGFVFGNAGPSGFADSDQLRFLLGLANSKIVSYYTKIFSPTLNFEIGDVGKIPVLSTIDSNSVLEVCRSTDELVNIACQDWNSLETSWDFQRIDLVTPGSQDISDAYKSRVTAIESRISRTKTLEERNNKAFIDAYELNGDLTFNLTEEQISITRADREKDCQRLMSYSIGCMMGRYSLDVPGLIYAHAGNIDFDASRYTTFPADADGIVPLTDELWFDDDAASRIREFLLAVWGVETLAENMAWLAESLGSKAGETPDETIRRYLADKFYKDHLQTYKKRPIYWLFSSGKQGAFQALVYLHRYNEGTLARMRAEYVVPLTGKIQSRIDMLQKDAAAASSTAARNKLAKEVEKLKKKHVELLAYDEQIRHYADMRITLDLDDGVKVNYSKFGNLLDSVKAVTSGAQDE
jgi:hypothetical protein